MKRIALVSVLTILVIISASFARPMWPKQPKISEAYESLNAALAQVEKSRAGESAKHLGRASAALLVAKSDLETAKKNKGSARIEAIKLIDQAKVEIDAAETDAKHLDAANDCISKALEQVSRAADNGR